MTQGYRSSARAIATARAFVILLSSGISAPVFAQSPPASPTPEQLEAFRNLPPEQQRALLDALHRENVETQVPDPAAPAVPPPDPRGLLPSETERERDGERLVPRMERGSTLILEVRTEPTDDPLLTETRRSRQERMVSQNPYRLDGESRLHLPFLPPIALGGLTAEEAGRRLSADPRLDGLVITVELLPVEPTGPEALKPFGYEIFRGAPTTFAPAADIPVPPDYVLGPGDSVVVTFFGKRSGRFSLLVDREGRLHIPEFGPMTVAGRAFPDVREEIERRISEQTIGLRASVTMGPLRSMRVFVLGDVVRPGSYTVSGLSTVIHALFASGGVSEVGSLRRIELKRAGATVARLDLYDLLLRGDTANDRRLQSGDAIFVPPVGDTAGIAGSVRRPAIYEVVAGARVSDLLALSGGLAPDADPRAAKLERIDSEHQRVVLDVDLSSPGARTLQLMAGDVLIVPRVLDQLARSVSLEGHVVRPGRSAWRQGMRLTDLLGSLDALKLNADQRYLLIRREHFPQRRVEVLSADALAAFHMRGSDADPVLQTRDRVIVFSMQSDRGDVLSELLDEQRLQTRDSQAPRIVSVSGRVRAPGQYPLEPGMTVADLVRAGGGLDEAAFVLEAELTRLVVTGGEARHTEVLDVNLADILAGSADPLLQPYDMLVVKQTPEWSEQGTVALSGEVRFPGSYPIRRGETLSSVVRRAGGLTDRAFPEGAVFTREEIREQERRQFEELATRLQNDLALVALQGAQTVSTQPSNAGEALAIGQSLLSQLRAARPTGRLVINLDEALAQNKSDQDIELRDGDALAIPPRRQFVAVIGEAQNPTSHVWRERLERDDYVQMSGGTTSNADEGRIYIVRANGSVVRAGGRRWFASGSSEIRPGDTIVVPLDTQKLRPLPLWTAVSSIIYHLAVAVAAVNSF